MLEEGLLGAAGAAAPSPSGAFAIHISNRYRSGEIHLKPGPIMASTDVIRIWVRGRGGHASTPHLAQDPIPVAAEIILALQAMLGRHIDVFDPAVVSISQVVAGTTSNIIPEEAFLHGTIRTVSEETRARVRAGVRRVAEGVAAAHGVSADVDLEPGYPVTVNDAGFTDFARSVSAGLVGAERVVELRAPVMGGEDWSYLLQEVPGAMVFLGACPPDLDPATAPQFHSNRVVFDEAILPIGVALHAAIATRFLAAGA
jgi:amidohydrolase